MAAKKNKTTSSQTGLQKPPSQTTIFVVLPPEVITKKANELAHKGYSWDDLNWMIGENNLRLANATKEIPNHTMTALPSHIPVDPSKIIKIPPLKDVQHKAEEISTRHLPFPQLYWDLAIQDYILDEINL